jgi:hypothetical protein
MNPLSLLVRYERGRALWRHVDVRGPDECWRWRGEVDRSGEPTFHGRPAANAVYERARGRIEAGRRLERCCPNRRCVNPEHMRLRSPTLR